MKSQSINESFKPSDRIGAKEHFFKYYLVTDVLKGKYFPYLDELAKTTEVYIFSGVIRDFFVRNMQGARDLDIVVGKIPQSFIDSLNEDKRVVEYKKNKFNGLKIIFKDLSVDLWEMKDTWGIAQRKLPINVDSLLKTPFFNFSSIVFDYNNIQFITGEPFKTFLDEHILDVVFPENVEPESCLVSSIYYSKKYKMKMGSKLMEWLKDEYDENTDYSRFQIKRFGSCMYSKDDIKNFINQLN